MAFSRIIDILICPNLIKRFVIDSSVIFIIIVFVSGFVCVCRVLATFFDSSDDGDGVRFLFSFVNGLIFI